MGIVEVKKKSAKPQSDLSSETLNCHFATEAERLVDDIAHSNPNANIFVSSQKVESILTKLETFPKFTPGMIINYLKGVDDKKLQDLMVCL